MHTVTGSPDVPGGQVAVKHCRAFRNVTVQDSYENIPGACPTKSGGVQQSFTSVDEPQQVMPGHSSITSEQHSGWGCGVGVSVFGEQALTAELPLQRISQVLPEQEYVIA